jgi:ABC-type glycerol-3-phosphate transport system substrate-binding protein
MKHPIHRLQCRRQGRAVSAPARVIIGALAVFAFGGAAYASASVSSSKGTTTISLLTWGDAKYAKGQFQLYQEFFPKDSAHTKLDVRVGGANDTEAVNQFRLMLSSHNAPDIVQMNRSAVAEFAHAGQLANVKPFLAAYLPGMTAAARTLMQYNGSYVAVPYEVKEKLWYYRSDLFAQAGIDVTKVKTQADFIAAGKRLHAKFPKSYIWNLAANPQAYILGEITSGNGARISDPKTGKFVVGSDPGMYKAFKALADLRASGVVATSFDDWSPEWQSGLADGTIASVPVASWFSTFLPQYAPKLAGKWAVTTWPEIGGAVNGGGSEAAGSVFVIPKGSKHKAEALKFLADMFMTKKGSLLVFHAYNAVPNVTAAQKAPAVLDNAYFGASLIKAFQAASPAYKVFPYDPAALKEITTINNALSTFLASGSSDPTSALQTAQQQLTAQIGNPWKR